MQTDATRQGPKMRQKLKDIVARVATPLKPGLRKQRRIILHIGPHRTGTTTIQTMLEKNRDALPKRFAVMTRADAAQADVSRLIQRARTLNGARKRVPEVRAAAAIVAKQCKADVTIISDEDLLGALPTRFNIKGLYPFLETLLPAAIEGYASAGAQVTVAWSVRHFPDWLESVYHRRHDFAPPEAFRFRRYRLWYDMPSSWRLFVPRLANVCGDAEIIQLAFADDLKTRFMGRRLLQTVGFTEEELAALQRPRPQNVSKTRRGGKPPVLARKPRVQRRRKGVGSV